MRSARCDTLLGEHSFKQLSEYHSQATLGTKQMNLSSDTCHIHCMMTMMYCYAVVIYVLMSPKEHTMSLFGAELA